MCAVRRESLNVFVQWTWRHKLNVCDPAHSLHAEGREGRMGKKEINDSGVRAKEVTLESIKGGREIRTVCARARALLLARVEMMMLISEPLSCNCPV